MVPVRWRMWLLGSNASASDAFMQETRSQYEMHTCTTFVDGNEGSIVLSSLN